MPFKPQRTRTAAPPSLFDAPAAHAGSVTSGCRGCLGVHAVECAACGRVARHWVEADAQHEMALCNRCERLMSEIRDAAAQHVPPGTYTPDERQEKIRAQRKAYHERTRQQRQEVARATVHDEAWRERRQAAARARYAARRQEEQRQDQAS